MPMYKVGDYVTVRGDLSPDTDYYMKDNSGNYNRAVVDMFEKEYSCYWSDEMFEDIITVAEIDDESRVNNSELSSDVSIKDLFGLYNL